MADRATHRICVLSAWLGGGILLVFLICVGIFVYTYHHIDYAADEALFELAQGSRTTRIYYRDPGQEGQVGERLLSCGTDDYIEWETQRLHGTANAIWCPYAQIPQSIKDAFVAIEDKRFFHHQGVDWLRTVRAAANYILKFDGRFGGSTITQQLIKNISSDDDISISRKLREICRAIHLENTHSKEEILELYLNIVPLSQGCIGVGAAAEHYFDKPVSELTLRESAAIAAITNSPVRFDPVHAEKNNRARRDLILHEMLDLQMITEEAYQTAVGEATVLHLSSENNEQIYDWYTETVITDVITDLMKKNGLSHEVAEKMVYSGGLQIYTQMDYRVQQTLNVYFENQANFPFAAPDGLQYAMTVCDPYTGDLLGIVSGVGKKTGNRILNYGSTVLRAPGSAIKPLSVYAPALEEGKITWSSVEDDVPLIFQQGTAWPHNSPAIYSGLTDMQDAVAYSKNTVAVRVFEKIGAEKSFAYLSYRLGLNSLLRGRATEGGGHVTDLATAPLALGQLTDGVTVRALTNAYSTLANGGVFHPSRSYCLVLDGKGNVLLENRLDGERVFREETAGVMTKLLEGVVAYGTAGTVRMEEMVDTAGKTGTSGDNMDKWFVGYTPYYTAGIWCGYADGKTAIPNGASKTHLAVWDAVMHRLHQTALSSTEPLRSFTLPQGIVRRAYCKDSGLLPCDACRKDPRGNRISVGYFKAGDEPKTQCNCHVMVKYDCGGGGVARNGCPAGEVREIGLLRLPERSFPYEVYVTDAQYGYRSITDDEKTCDRLDRPFYDLLIPDGEYVGISKTENGKQFNSMCPIHDDEPSREYEDEVEDTPDGFDDLFSYFRRYFQYSKD